LTNRYNRAIIVGMEKNNMENIYVDPEAFTAEWQERQDMFKYLAEISEIQRIFGFSFEEAVEYYNSPRYETPIDELLEFFDKRANPEIIIGCW
jgi:hypothetical protein